MNNIFKALLESKHIVLIADSSKSVNSLTSASVLYSYILTLHKKVSFYSVVKELEPRLMFIPWSDKARSSLPSSADLAISFNCETINSINLECNHINISSTDGKGMSQMLFDYLINSNIKINQKMATALYAGLLDETDGFLNESVNGTIFAMSKQLVDFGADIKTVNRFILKYITFGAFRLKAIMQMNMQLIADAKVAMFEVTKENMLATGANMKDVEKALQEALFLPTVEVAFFFIRSDNLTVEGFFIFKNSANKKYSFIFRDLKDKQEIKIKILKLINKEKEIE